MFDQQAFTEAISIAAARASNRAGRAGLGQQWAGPKLARFFRAKILVAHPTLKTGLVGPNSILKAKKNSGKLGRVGPYLARFISGQ